MNFHSTLLVRFWLNVIPRHNYQYYTCLHAGFVWEKNVIDSFRKRPFLLPFQHPSPHLPFNTSHMMFSLTNADGK